MPPTFALTGLVVLDDGTKTADAVLVVQHGKILHAGSRQKFNLPVEFPVIEAHGWAVSPGLIDLQLNGAYGHDFTTDPDSLLPVAQRLPETGVTAFLPTFITSPIDSYTHKLLRVAEMQHSRVDKPAVTAKILGAHIEGPFLNPAKKGAHPQDLFLEPGEEALAKLQPVEAVRLLTLAPELPQGLAAVRWLRDRNIVVSIGHSAAGMEETFQAIEAGITCATHLFNAMRGMEHRDPGLVGTLLGERKLYCGLIADGIHVHPEMIKLAYRCLGSERIFLVTDAISAMGMPVGRYPIGDQIVFVDRVSARLADGTLAGSVLNLDQAVRNMLQFSGCSPAEALRMATLTPACAIGLEQQFGRLSPGYPADLVLFNESFDVQATFVDGNLVYATPGAMERLSTLSNSL